MLMTILRKFTVLFLTLSLCVTTVACGSNVNQTTSQTSRNNQTTKVSRISDGQYPVQQASYNDGDGTYTLFLLNSPTPTYTTEKLQMARLTDEQIKQGDKTYLKVENGQPALYLTEDFKIEYVHNVTETKTNPQTGQQETVIVRRESNFWAPFAGALAGQVVGNLLFRPQYYVPPAYQPGSVLTGYGGYGRSYDVAVDRYRQRYNEPPASVRNRTAFRRTGSIRRSSPNTSRTRQKAGTRSTGSGFGSSKLRSSGKSRSVRRRSNTGFGSSRRSIRRPTGFGGRRR
ncbi:MAG: hypothetical protein QNJ63_04490 [Calothrix sp. MO_192.B10]|nr:hypothetical protein [Calothrix sp. MO_192.B10]